MTLLHNNSGDLWKSNYQQHAAPAYNLLVHFTAYLDINCHWTLRNSELLFSVVHKRDHTVSWPSMFFHEPSASKRSPQTPSAINLMLIMPPTHKCSLHLLFVYSYKLGMKQIPWKQFHSPSIQSSVFELKEFIIYYSVAKMSLHFPFQVREKWGLWFKKKKKLDLWHVLVMKIAT